MEEMIIEARRARSQETASSLASPSSALISPTAEEKPEIGEAEDEEGEIDEEKEEKRKVQRKNVVMEIITTEEDYVSDMEMMVTVSN